MTGAVLVSITKKVVVWMVSGQLLQWLQFAKF